MEDHAAARLGPRLTVTLHRTLRIPDDGREYPLPPGLGAFPVFRVDDYADRLAPAWRGGVFVPMYQGEALWLGFNGARWKPNAVTVAVGGVNAVSGLADDEDTPRAEPRQNYLVCPNQPWLDGINSGRGTVRQFVAMPLGEGYTVESAVTGAETLGGIRITAFEPKPGVFPDEPPSDAGLVERNARGPAMGLGQVMGLGAGGRMTQKIYPDPYGVEVWDAASRMSVLVHILNSAQFREVTGRPPPPTPVDAALYAKHGLPWFALYDEDAGDVAPAPGLAGAKTIAERDAELGRPPSRTAGDPLDPNHLSVHKLSPDGVAGHPARPARRREHPRSAEPE